MEVALWKEENGRLVIGRRLPLSGLIAEFLKNRKPVRVFRARFDYGFGYAVSGEDREGEQIVKLYDLKGLKLALIKERPSERQL